MIDQQTKKIGRFESLLNNTDDLTAVIVKGHIAAEEILRHLVSRKRGPSHASKDAKLSFSLLVKLSKTLGFLSDELEETLRVLNALRNAYAHNLEPLNTTEKIDLLYSLTHVGAMTKLEGFEKPTSPVATVELSIYAVLAQLDFLVTFFELIDAVTAQSQKLANTNSRPHDHP